MVGCPTCGAELTYIAPYGRHYCYACRSYAPKTLHECDTCGRALVFVQQYHRYYCYGCQEYKEDPGVRNPCPTCGEELDFIPQYDRFYCYQCRAYAPKEYGLTRGRRKRMTSKHEAASTGYAPFSREDLDLASKEQLMNWCREYGLDDSGMKYELRLRLLEHVRKQGLLLKGEEPQEVAAATASQESKVTEEVQAEGSQPAKVEQQEATPEPAVEAPQAVTPRTTCPTCGGELTYIPQYDRWYCYACQSYPPREETAAAPRVEEPARSPQATRAVKVRTQRQGNPMVGISLAILGLLMFVAYALLYRAPNIFDVPVFIRAPEIGFALWFLSFVFVAMGLMASVLLVRPRG